MATKKSNNPLTAMSAGCIAGAVEATAVWPMEFIKTRLQLGSKSPGSKLPYSGMLEGLSYTVKNTGFLRYVDSESAAVAGSRSFISPFFLTGYLFFLCIVCTVDWRRL